VIHDGQTVEHGSPCLFAFFNPLLGFLLNSRESSDFLRSIYWPYPALNRLLYDFQMEFLLKTRHNNVQLNMADIEIMKNQIQTDKINLK